MGIREGDFRRRGRRHVRPRSLAHPFATFFSPRVRRSLFAQPTNQPTWEKEKGIAGRASRTALNRVELTPDGRDGGRERKGRRARATGDHPNFTTGGGYERDGEGRRSQVRGEPCPRHDRPTDLRSRANRRRRRLCPSLPPWYALCTMYIVFRKDCFQGPKSQDRTGRRRT